MSEQALHSDEQAALIEAHKQAHALEQRYRYLCEELVEDQSWRPFLSNRQQSLAALRRQLEGRLEDQDLLPHDINVDREDLTRLADRVREWLDGEGHDPLKKALSGQERALLDALRALPASDRSRLTKAMEQAVSTIDDLGGEAD